jgi:lysophospholipid acyltransferase (LPLAT)-like uncharacterized protein
MVAELKQERAILMTADVPKRARIAGIGAAKLAQISGAPIHCFAALTDRRFELNNWDRTHVVKVRKRLANLVIVKRVEPAH